MYQKGLTDLGDGLLAYLQPDGSWGWSNAGVVSQGGTSLLVDTLFDRALTRDMLGHIKRALPNSTLDIVVNTHANGDHCWGNQEVSGARIIASRKAAKEMMDLPPGRLAAQTLGAKLAVKSGPLRSMASLALGGLGISKLANMLDAAPLVARSFAPFEFGGITLTPPTETFDNALDVMVGNRKVQLIEVGPAHTTGDVVVNVPDAGVVFTGDILFNLGHPIVWEGPLSNWVNALDRVLALKPRVVVPGHGPLTDAHGLERMREYLVYVEAQATRSHAEGLDAETAAREMVLDGFSGWLDAERIAVNVETVYRHLEGRQHEPMDVVALFARMERLARAKKRW